MGLRDRLRRLERVSEEATISIPQNDGTVARFPASTVREAFLNSQDRLGAGEGAPLEHPMLAAVRNSPDPRWWRDSMLATTEPEEWTALIQDLSG